MKKIETLVLLIFLMLSFSIDTCLAKQVSIIPVPSKVVKQKGRFSLSKQAKLYIKADGKDVQILNDYLLSSNLNIVKGNGNDSNIIIEKVSQLDNVSSEEGYDLNITTSKITIRATSGAGLFYGVQSLLQLINDNKNVSCMRIIDSPRFDYRGVMLDVSRHFYGKDFVKKQIDAMAHYKLNRLHLHLTDAAGWRIEIKKYPRLTQFAAWRDAENWKKWWNGGRKYMNEGEDGAHGGYFTQAEIKELVEYAANHFITIIPEIEMPAHSEEVLAAYPELSCSGIPYKNADFCVGNENTFEFLQNVLLEVMDMFPSKDIHIGGDEAGKQAWKRCPKCQARMKTENLKDVNELQSYLIHRIEKFLNAHGRNLLGWDEILEGGLAPNATVMSWRGIEGGVKAVKSGHRAIMSPGEYCYLDAYQDAPYAQAEAIGGYLPLKKVYSYNPIPSTFTKEESKLIHGVQANLWTEYVPTADAAEKMLWPRVLALSEVAWSEVENKNYGDFHKRVLSEVRKLQAKGYTTFDIKNEIGDRSNKKSNSIAVGKKVKYMEGAAFYKDYSAGGDSALVDGIHGGWTYGDKKWQGLIDKNGMDIVIDMEKTTKIKYVGADFMQVCAPEVFMPCQVTISVSDDGENFTILKTMDHEVVKDDKVTFITFSWKGKTKARYIRYQAKKGPYHGFLFTDEVVVK